MNNSPDITSVADDFFWSLRKILFIRPSFFKTTLFLLKKFLFNPETKKIKYAQVCNKNNRNFFIDLNDRKYLFDIRNYINTKLTKLGIKNFPYLKKCPY